MTQIYPNVGTAMPVDTTVHGICGKSAAVAWPAIIAGGVTAAVVTLGLTIFGSSLGLAMLSPWTDEGASAKGLAIGAIIWMIVTQWISSGLGGYLAGRLRIRWNYTHNDEVFFRDTAHGFLTWSIATLITACFLTSAASTMVGAGTQAAATLGAGAMAHQAMAAKPPAGGGKGGMEPMATDYYIDTLFRSEQTAAPANDREIRMETMRIIMTAAKDGAFTAEDKTYLSQLVARRAGVSDVEANRRVDNLVAQIDAAKVKAKDVADKARKSAASIAIFTFLSMLIGAFIASVAAALGGRERDYISA